MKRTSTFFDPLSVSCLLLIAMLATMVAAGVRTVRAMDDGTSAPAATQQLLTER